MKYILLIFLAFLATSTSSLALSTGKNMEAAEAVYASQTRATEKQFDASKQWKTIVGASFVVVVIVGLALIPKGILIYVAWRKKTTRKEEPENNEELASRTEPKLDIYYEELRDLAKNNDPVFLQQFMEAYPDFTHHLLEKHPGLSKSEPLLCAMIYLNFSSKEIAEYTFIQHRSVQTNRSRMRKRMELSPDVDLFHYIHSFT